MGWRRMPFAALAVALALLGAACSASPRASSDGVPGATGASEAAGAGARAPLAQRGGGPPPGTPTSNPSAAADVPAPKPDRPTCVNDVPELKAQPTGTFVAAYVRWDLPWERRPGRCPRLQAGADCWIPFHGGWRLMEAPSGSMVFQAFENGASVPVRSPEVGPIPAAGQFSPSTRFHYVPGKDAKSVTFRVLLKDPTGRVVAHSEPQTLSIPECQASP